MVTPLMTADDVAHRLNCSRHFVYKLRRTGRLAGIAIGGLWRFDPADVDECITQMKKRTQEVDQ